MAYRLSFHFLLLAIGVIFFQILLSQQPNVEAYTTYEISQHCRRHQPSSKERDRRTFNFGKISKRMESQNGLVVPESFDDEDHEEDEEATLKASQSITVDHAYDDSAIRVLLSREDNRSRQRNWQHCSIFVAAKKPNGLIVTIRKLHLRSGIDWLRLAINNGTFVREFSHVKIDDERDSVAYVANHGVLIELVTGYSAFSPPEDNQVELILTSFREADLCMLDTEFDCGSFRCISNFYVCDGGVNNCGDGRDETGCPLDNLTNYIIISLLLLLAATFIFLCVCYRCCCSKQKRYTSRGGKQYQYVKIRTNSLAPVSNGIVKRRAASIASESDALGALPPAGTFTGGRHNSLGGENLRRFRLTHMADSMPVLVPSAPTDSNGYGSTGNTYLYPTYATIQLGSSGYGLIPAHHIFGPSTSRVAFAPYGQAGANSMAQPGVAASSGGEPHRFPLPQQAPYPMMHPNLFTPPTPNVPPPAYSPRNGTAQSAESATQQGQSADNGQQPPSAPSTTN